MLVFIFVNERQQDEWKILANTVRQADINEESFRCLELDHLYRNFYGWK